MRSRCSLSADIRTERVRRGRVDPVRIKPPVAPWPHALEPELFAHDPSIRYCGDLEKGFEGRILKRYAGRLFFTFKDALETDVTLRGFARIGLVGRDRS